MTNDHPNIEQVRGALDAFAKGDLDTYRSHMAEDIVWHVGGDHPFTGDYRGRDALFGYFADVDKLTGGTLRVEPQEILADDTHAAVFAHVTASRGPLDLDVVLAQAITFDDEGRWTEYWALADNQRAVDAFWTEAGSNR